MCPLQLFHTFYYVHTYICHFDQTFSCIPLTISSCYTKHTSFSVCTGFLIILEFRIHVSHPYVITGSTHWSYAFIFKHSGMLDLKTMFSLQKKPFLVSFFVLFILLYIGSYSPIALGINNYQLYNMIIYCDYALRAKFIKQILYTVIKINPTIKGKSTNATR
jgi:hypothetical protein